MSKQLSITQFSNRLCRNHLIRLALCFEHPEFTDEILWAIRKQRWDLLDSRCLEYITRTVKEASITTRTFYGLSESGGVFEINIREFDKIYWIWVPQSIEIGFFRTRTDANNHAQDVFQNEIDAYRKAKKRAAERTKKEPVRECVENDERKETEMVERYFKRLKEQAPHAQHEAP